MTAQGNALEIALGIQRIATNGTPCAMLAASP
jgi:hypothetical protein